MMFRRDPTRERAETIVLVTIISQLKAQEKPLGRAETNHMTHGIVKLIGMSPMLEMTPCGGYIIKCHQGAECGHSRKDSEYFTDAP